MTRARIIRMAVTALMLACTPLVTAGPVDPCEGSTPVGGQQAGNWNECDGPYLLTSNITINGSLSISAGTVIDMNNHVITVNGSLSASGAIFMDGGTVSFITDASGSLSGCTLTGGCDVFVDSDAVSITGCDFLQNTFLEVNPGSPTDFPTVTGNIFSSSSPIRVPLNMVPALDANTFTAEGATVTVYAGPANGLIDTPRSWRPSSGITRYAVSSSLTITPTGALDIGGGVTYLGIGSNNVVDGGSLTIDGLDRVDSGDIDIRNGGIVTITDVDAYDLFAGTSSAKVIDVAVQGTGTLIAVDTTFSEGGLIRYRTDASGSLSGCTLTGGCDVFVDSDAVSITGCDFLQNTFLEVNPGSPTDFPTVTGNTFSSSSPIRVPLNMVPTLDANTFTAEGATVTVYAGPANGLIDTPRSWRPSSGITRYAVSSSLTITPTGALDIGGGVTYLGIGSNNVVDGGSLTIDGLDRVDSGDIDIRNGGIVTITDVDAYDLFAGTSSAKVIDVAVQGTGTLIAVDTTFSEGGLIRYRTDASGSLSGCTLTGGCDVFVDSDAVSITGCDFLQNTFLEVNPGSPTDFPTVTGNIFSSSSPIRVPLNMVPALDANTFTAEGATVTVYAGPANGLIDTPRSWRPSSGITRYAVSSSLTITPTGALDIGGGVTYLGIGSNNVVDGGSLTIDGLDRVDSGDIDIRNGGIVTITDVDAYDLFAGTSSAKVIDVAVQGTGTLIAVDTTFSEGGLIRYRADASGSLSGCTLTGGCDVHWDANAVGIMTYTRFESSSRLRIGPFVSVLCCEFYGSIGSVEAVGDSESVIDMTGNYWGTTDIVEISEKILDNEDQPSRPSILFFPFRLFPCGTFSLEQIPRVLDGLCRIDDAPPLNPPLDAAENLVIITHGWNGPAGESAEHLWVQQTADAFVAYLQSTGQAQDWDVIAFYWRECASTFLPYLPSYLGAGTARRNAITIGNMMADDILAADYSHVHFIGHSAGTWMGDAIADILANDSSVTTHLTLLDPFVPLGVGEPGDSADHVENYYVSGELLPWTFSEIFCGLTDSPDYPCFTQACIASSYNIDISLRWDQAGQPADAHAYAPSIWYIETIQAATAGASHQDFPLGFGQSKAFQQGSWEQEVLNNPARDPGLQFNAGIGEGIPCSENSDAFSRLVDWVTDPTFPSDPLDVIIDPLGIELNPNPVRGAESESSGTWINTEVNIDTRANQIEFSYMFTSTTPMAEGVLTVFWNGDEVDAFLESTSAQGTFTRASASLGVPADPGTHILSFRLDDNGLASSSVRIEQAEIGIEFNADVNSDSLVDAEDLYHWFDVPVDVDGDGLLTALDRILIRKAIRENESFDISN